MSIRAMESMPIVCQRMLAGSAVLVFLLLIGTCRAFPGPSEGVVSAAAPSQSGAEQSPVQMEEMQREWDELLFHCRGLVPSRQIRRLGSEFLGKRSSSGPSLTDAAVQWCSDKFSENHWLCTCLFPTDSSETDEIESDEAMSRPVKRGLGAILLSGKRMNNKWAVPMNRRIMGSEFLGKRALGSEFLGKRARPLGSEFLGKRSVIPPNFKK